MTRTAPTLDNFAKDDVRDQLNAMTIAEITVMLGGPQERVVYVKAPGWQPGDERPDLANDDPAVQQAIARCATSQIQTTAKFPMPLGTHRPCEFCEYPLAEKLKACAWAVHQSGYIEAHVFVWTDQEGRTYARAGGDTGYRNKVHRAFWELPIKERERRIAQAAGAK